MQLVTAMRSPVWPGILAALIIIGLVVSFHQVVRGAVQQGESRRKATATRVEAGWRCNTMRSLVARADCLLRLDAPTRDDLPLRPGEDVQPRSQDIPRDAASPTNTSEAG
jgi:hypothetical protein